MRDQIGPLASLLVALSRSASKGYYLAATVPRRGRDGRPRIHRTRRPTSSVRCSGPAPSRAPRRSARIPLQTSVFACCHSSPFTGSRPIAIARGFRLIARDREDNAAAHRRSDREPARVVLARPARRRPIRPAAGSPARDLWPDRERVRFCDHRCALCDPRRRLLPVSMIAMFAICPTRPRKVIRCRSSTGAV